MGGKGALQDPTSYTVFKTALGWCGRVMAGGKIVRLCIGYSTPERLIRYIIDEFGRKALAHPGHARAIETIKDYCAGKRVSLAGLPMDWSSLTAFEQKVLRAAMRIPYGHVETYGSLARMIGTPNAARAVGNALAKNPFPLIVPCHRIVRGNGRVGGFSAGDGTALKWMLLQMENGR